LTGYALTIFIGAFLLFQIQPLIGKYILPWFGGGPGVWTTCMLFFQIVLVAGYAYGHVTSHRFQPKAQAMVHLILLIATLALLPIIPSDSWKPRGAVNPTLQILLLLTCTVGLPYFVLASTSPLLQQWFSRTKPNTSPYRLYALSNLGSLLALVSFPFYFETHFTRKTQALLWAWGLVAYAIVCGFCAIKFWWNSAQADGNQLPAFTPTVPGRLLPEGDQARPAVNDCSLLQRLLWLLLPACASVLVLAITNKLCQDVAVIPFLWVLPLGIYLLSFIISFDNPRWYQRFPFALGLVAALTAICWTLFHAADASLTRQIEIYSAGLFICCMVCHGELYRLKPQPAQLTGFYLTIAAGGALGGVFVAIIAPLAFNDYFELHWGLLLCALLFIIACARDRADSSRLQWIGLACVLPLVAFGGLDWSLARLSGRAGSLPKAYFIGLRLGIWLFLGLVALSWVVRKNYRRFQHWQFLACVWLVLGAAALAVTLRIQTRSRDHERVYITRNFYGVLTVYEHHKTEPDSHHFLLQHGRITHGLQFVDVDRSRWPTTYYGTNSGVGLALAALTPGPRRIGLVGLGTATLTAYAGLEDELRIYEINPEVYHIATTLFTYLSNCLGKANVILGDARLSLEREPPQGFDLLALDAFNSDAIPVHLLTKEAFALYDQHLNTNGIIAVHISNHYLDLEPVVVNLARHFNYHYTCVDYDERDEDWWEYGSTWMLLARQPAVLDTRAIRNAAVEVKTNSPLPLWTDDFSALFQILK
jgi:hypothetical protein